MAEGKENGAVKMVNPTFREALLSRISRGWPKRPRWSRSVADYAPVIDRGNGLPRYQGHHPCKECGKVMITHQASVCFRCGEYDREIFDELDRRIKAGIIVPRGGK